MHAANGKPVPDSVLHRAVAQYFPAALTGGMGKRPAVWFAADSTNRVLQVADGRDDIVRGLTWDIAASKLPGVPRSASPGDVLQWGKVGLPNDTVDVIWVRLYAGLP